VSLTASDHILGIPVGSTAPAFLTVLAVHVTAGLTAVVSGAGAALTPKGPGRHARFGRVYYRAIVVVFATATVLTAMRWQQNWYLLAIGVAAFTAGTVGYLARRRHWPGAATGPATEPTSPAWACRTSHC
jgi:hypothetical protein